MVKKYTYDYTITKNSVVVTFPSIVKDRYVITAITRTYKKYLNKKTKFVPESKFKIIALNPETNQIQKDIGFVEIRDDEIIVNAIDNKIFKYKKSDFKITDKTPRIGKIETDNKEYLITDYETTPITDESNSE